MGNGSSAYAELGGGIGTPIAWAPRPLPASGASVVADAPAHRHRFHPQSGWCGCGRRDDGSLAEGSPAWRAARAGRAS